LLEEDLLSAEAMELIRSELNAEVVVATEYALTRPVVESTAEAEAADLFAPAGPMTRRAVEPHKTERRFVDAIGDGLRQAMEHDDSVLVLGQDVAGYGGVFKVTEGFLDRFGAGRVRNTPIIESGAVGAALGLAIDGYKPVVEIQYADFIACAHNQIVNNLATTHYRWGAPINVTLRAPFGGSIGAGPFHSQSMEAWYCHTPGLKVVVPATPYDAKGLLLAAIEDPNPVLFFEHKYLYRAIREEIPDAPYTVEIGKARIAREGSDATIVTWGIGLRWALAEAEEQAGQGRSIEVVDLRTLVPWDRETILASVAKTSRLLVLHEAPLTGGFGAEIAATVAQEGFDLLDAPPLRVAGADLPVPFSKKLESEIYSAESRLRGALERLFSY
jgi:2-oxoisovalerate dehydrogenase E1 component